MQGEIILGYTLPNEETQVRESNVLLDSNNHSRGEDMFVKLLFESHNISAAEDKFVNEPDLINFFYL